MHVHLLLPLRGEVVPKAPPAAAVASMVAASSSGRAPPLLSCKEGDGTQTHFQGGGKDVLASETSSDQENADSNSLTTKVVRDNANDIEERRQARRIARTRSQEEVRAADDRRRARAEAKMERDYFYAPTVMAAHEPDDQVSTWRCPRSPGSAFTPRPGTSGALSSKGPGFHGRHVVWLHIYDLNNVMEKLNNNVLQQMDLGVFHCGVEVLGCEWYFAWGEGTDTGMRRGIPRKHPVHVYKESVMMGPTPMSTQEVHDLLNHLRLTWPENSYHPVKRNCIAFAEAIIKGLKVAKPFPARVQGAPRAGRSACVSPAVDVVWRWTKWWCSEEQESSYCWTRTR